MDIITAITQDWKNFGIYFDFDEAGRTLNCIAKDYHYHSIDCCTQMMTEWLEGSGRQPATWATLIDLLKDAEMNDLAQQLVTIFIIAWRKKGVVGGKCGEEEEEEREEEGRGRGGEGGGER